MATVTDSTWIRVFPHSIFRISYLSDAENVVQAREKHANGKACQRKTMRMRVVEFEMVLLKVILGDFC